MRAVTIRNLPDSTHRALKARAALHGRSTEAEIREILQHAVQPSIGLGTLLAGIGKDLKEGSLPAKRDRRPVKLARFK